MQSLFSNAQNLQINGGQFTNSSSKVEISGLYNGELGHVFTERCIVGR